MSLESYIPTTKTKQKLNDCALQTEIRSRFLEHFVRTHHVCYILSPFTNKGCIVHSVYVKFLHKFYRIFIHLRNKNCLTDKNNMLALSNAFTIFFWPFEHICIAFFAYFQKLQISIQWIVSTHVSYFVRGSSNQTHKCLV